VDEQAFGSFIGYARNALLAWQQFHDEEQPQLTQEFIGRLAQLFTGDSSN